MTPGTREYFDFLCDRAALLVPPVEPLGYVAPVIPGSWLPLRAATCSDCPPLAYPTDATRCADCPRRTSR